MTTRKLKIASQGNAPSNGIWSGASAAPLTAPSQARGKGAWVDNFRVRELTVRLAEHPAGVPELTAKYVRTPGLPPPGVGRALDGPDAGVDAVEASFQAAINNRCTHAADFLAPHLHDQPARCRTLPQLHLGINQLRATTQILQTYRLLHVT